MTLLHSQHDFCRVASRGSRFSLVAAAWPPIARRLKRLARAAARSAGALFRNAHLAIITAKLRRLGQERMMHHDVHDPSVSQQSDDHGHPPTCAANLPQRPLILDDKWDF